MNKIGLKNVGLRVQVYTRLLHQTGPDYLLFILPSRQSPNCWLCYEKLKLFAFHIILSPTPLHHLPIIWKAFITKSFSFLKSHSCPTYITFKWIQNLCWSPRIWTTESRYSTFISFHQIPQLQILNSIQTLNFTCNHKSLLTTAQHTTRLQNLIDVKTRQTLKTQYVTLWLIW